MRMTLTAALILAVAGRASAQGFTPYPGPRPPVSPYINLLRPGNPAINYYGIVRPQVDQQTINQQSYDRQLQEAALIQGLEPQPQPGEAPRYPTTGHPTQLLSHGRYFQTRGPAAAAQGAVAPGFLTRPAGGPVVGVNPAPAGRGAPTSR